MLIVWFGLVWFNKLYKWTKIYEITTEWYVCTNIQYFYSICPTLFMAKKKLFCIKNRKICFIFHLNIPIVAKRDNATLSVMCSFLLSRGSHNFIGMMMATSLRTGTETISSTLAAEILRYTKVQLQLHHYVFHHRFCMHFHDIFVIKTHNSRGSSHHQTSLIGLLLIAYICKCG